MTSITAPAHPELKLLCIGLGFQEAFIARAAHYAELMPNKDLFLKELAVCGFREFGNWPNWKGHASPLQIAAKLRLKTGVNFYDLFVVPLVVPMSCEDFVVFNYSRALGGDVIGIL